MLLGSDSSFFGGWFDDDKPKPETKPEQTGGGWRLPEVTFFRGVVVAVVVGGLLVAVGKSGLIRGRR